MRLPDETVAATCFIGVESDDGTIRPRATAFYVVVPFARDRRQGWGYLVTAKHSIVKSAGQTLYASINSHHSDRPADWLKIDVKRWFDHPDDKAADVAIADWRPGGEHWGSYFGFLTDSFYNGTAGRQFEIGLGMTISAIGLFHYHAGIQRHTPLVRLGTLSAIPADRVSTAMGAADAYLVELRSVGGLSGSPVLIHEDVYSGIQRHPLMGLIQGHYDWKDERESSEWQPIHTGIGVVTPSSKIMDILKSSECAETRMGKGCIF